MKAEKPIITSDRYSNLNSNDRRREYQRDLAIYEQAQMLEQLTNQKQEVSINVDNNLNEEYIQAIQEQNELLQDQIILQGLKGKERKEYLEKVQRKAQEKERRLELEYEVHEIFRRGSELTDVLEDFRMNMGEYTADKKMKAIKKIDKNLDTVKSGWDVFAMWFFILIFGGLGIGIYTTVLDSWGQEFNIIPIIIYVLILIIYPAISIANNKSNISKLNKSNKELEVLDNRYDKEVIPFRVYIKDISVREAIGEYKRYCIDYIKYFQEKYNSHRKDFSGLDEYIFEDTLEEINTI